MTCRYALLRSVAWLCVVHTLRDYDYRCKIMARPLLQSTNQKNTIPKFSIAPYRKGSFLLVRMRVYMFLCVCVCVCVCVFVCRKKNSIANSYGSLHSPQTDIPPTGYGWSSKSQYIIPSRLTPKKITCFDLLIFPTKTKKHRSYLAHRTLYKTQ